MGIFSFLSARPSSAITDRRQAKRHQPIFQASWRLLGDRTNTYYPAEVRDISASGIALFVPPALQLKAGAFIMIQLQNVPDPFVGPWLARVLYVEPNAEAGIAGCAFSSPFKEEDCLALINWTKNHSPQYAPLKNRSVEAYDPFVHGSQRERRRTPRRRGSMVAVRLAQNDKFDEAPQALVLDRSVGGLALLSSQEYPKDSLLKVRPDKAPDEVLWLPLWIRHCQPKRDEWVLGCEFERTPPTHVMLYFG